MRVLYDISVLGRGHYTLRSRTGIFRVTENIACGLVKSKECTLHFCASQSLEHVNQAIDYLEESELLKHIPFVTLETEKNFYQRFAGMIKKISDKPTLKNGFNALQRSYKVMQDSLNHTNRLINQKVKIVSAKKIPPIDIYHSPFHPFPECLSLAKSIKVVTIHDLIPIIYPEFYESNYQSSVQKVISKLKPQDWIICTSEATKNDLCNYRKDIDHSRVFIIHLAASEIFYPCNNPEKIKAIKKKLQIPDGPYILSLNTLEPRKNIAHTIRCFVKLVEEEGIKDLSLVIAGRTGWNYKDIFDEISNLPHLKERIIITKYAEDADLGALYSGALVFVFPSFYEGFGLPPLEAMQCGVPVITSNTSSLPEVVGDAGIMVSPTDANALCQSMLEIYLKPSLRQSLSKKSIKQAEKFSWQKCTQETIQVYKAALQ